MPEALNCLARSSDSGLAKAIKEMNDCGLVSRSTANIVLIPHDQAYQWLHSNNELAGPRDRMRTDSKYRCNVYAYHLLTTNRPSSHGRLAQEQRLRTDYMAPNGGRTFVSSYYIKDRDGSKLFFNGAPVRENKAIAFRNGFIYPLNTINFPPEQSILEILRSNDDLKTTMQKFATSNVEQDIKQQNGKVLFLAPVDLGWGSRQTENDYSAGQLRKLFKLHTIPHALFGGENGFLWHSTVQTVNSLLTDRRGEKIRLTIKRDLDGNTFIGHSELPESHWAMVLKWNLVGTDGMVWIIDWPIKCPDLEC